MATIAGSFPKAVWPGIKEWWSKELDFWQNATEADILRRRIKYLENHIDYLENHKEYKNTERNRNW